MKWQTHELYLRQLMAQKLGIPVLGELHFAIPAGSTTSLFEEYARTEMDIPAELISVGANAPADAFGDCSAYRNDVVLVFPGAYDIDTELAWNKDNTHLVGMAGPVNWTDYSEPGVAIYTDTAGTVDTIDVTGKYCQFHDVLVSNNGASTSSISAINHDGYGCYFKNVVIQGNMTSQQAGNANCASLIIDGGGYSCLFEDCTIGDNLWATLTTGSQLLFPSTGGPYNGIFRRCLFLAKIETAASVYMVSMGSASGGRMDRTWLFDKCHFSNFWTNFADQLDVCFSDGCSSTKNLMLRDCTSQGIDKWGGTGPNSRFGANMPIVGVGGGQARLPTAVTGS